MIKVKLSTAFPDWLLERQTPGAHGIWGNCEFLINKEIDECDYWVVYDDLLKPEKVRCLKENTLLITGEPPSVKKYSGEYINQFSNILTCHRDLKHFGVIYSQQGLPWMLGRKYFNATKAWENQFSKGYDEFLKVQHINKNKILSVILSKKVSTDGHKKRDRFIKMLKSELGDIFDVFGVGIRDIEDKWDGIAPYKYHLALENSLYPDYWTEKLSDAYLGGAFPIYYGCPNILDYFTEKCFARIDISKPKEAIKIIRETIDSNLYDRSLKYINEARQLILDKYNLFAVIAEIIEKTYHPKSGQLRDNNYTVITKDKAKSGLLNDIIFKTKKIYYFFKYF